MYSWFDDRHNHYISTYSSLFATDWTTTKVYYIIEKLRTIVVDAVRNNCRNCYPEVIHFSRENVQLGIGRPQDLCLDPTIGCVCTMTR